MNISDILNNSHPQQDSISILWTAITVLEERIEELEKKLKDLRNDYETQGDKTGSK